MKPNEFMLGDFFLVYSSMMPIKIAAVHKRKVAYHATPNKLTWVRMDLLRPIPLNPDILQRIGFLVEEEYDENYDDYEYYATLSCFDTRRCKVEIKYETSNNEISVFSSDRQNILQYRNVETQIQYVHELQNLFTIMQVEKEIEL